MTWEEKVTMMNLQMAGKLNPALGREFVEYVKPRLDSFDEQSWEMLCWELAIFEDKSIKGEEFWKLIYNKLHTCEVRNYSLSTQFRLEILRGELESLYGNN